MALGAEAAEQRVNGRFTATLECASQGTPLLPFKGRSHPAVVYFRLTRRASPDRFLGELEIAADRRAADAHSPRQLGLPAPVGPIQALPRELSWPATRLSFVHQQLDSSRP